ncbi:MAG TPA: NAD(P)-binding domain-containing protein [Gaiellaceae bacterium]|jgi:hypothetical protein|nr:NAD(P)-binding domain-containing protein [Gaiellaceae bacterium]
MKIGIIGAGNIGGTLTRRLTALGHDVSVANSGSPETLADLATETGATAATAENAVDGAELVVLAIPVARVPELLGGLFDPTAPGAPIVDTGNYCPNGDAQIAEIEDGLPGSRWVEQQLDRPVIKAFNTIRAQNLLERGREAGSAGRIALPVAGDDPAAKQAVTRLVEELGFDAIDAGGLDESWRHQPGTPAYGADLDSDNLRRALAQAGPARPDAPRG